MKLWIARHPNGKIGLYKGMPIWSLASMEYNWNYGGFIGYLDSSTFPEVTFENSPQEVELKLVSEIIGVAESPLKTFPRVNEFEVGASYRR